MNAIGGVDILEPSGQRLIPGRKQFVGADRLPDVGLIFVLQGADDAVMTDQGNLLVIAENHLAIIIGEIRRVQRCIGNSGKRTIRVVQPPAYRDGPALINAVKNGFAYEQLPRIVFRMRIIYFVSNRIFNLVHFGRTGDDLPRWIQQINFFHQKSAPFLHVVGQRRSNFVQVFIMHLDV